MIALCLPALAVLLCRWRRDAPLAVLALAAVADIAALLYLAKVDGGWWAPAVAAGLAGGAIGWRRLAGRIPPPR